MPIENEKLHNFIAGEWYISKAEESLEVLNPATAEVLATVPLSPASEVDAAAQAAAKAFDSWRHVPPPDRIQYLFELKNLLEYHFEEISRLITQENGTKEKPMIKAMKLLLHTKTPATA